MKRSVIFCLFFVLVSTAFANARLISTFDDEDDGWRAGNDVTLYWQDSGGNPGGFLQGNDLGNGLCWYYVSPTLWAGDWMKYQTLSFDLKIVDRDGGDPFSSDMVIIKGANDDSLTWSGDDPGDSWTYYELVLSPETFGVSEAFFNGVMSDVSELWIRGEYTDEHDIGGLDNVVVGGNELPDEIQSYLILTNSSAPFYLFSGNYVQIYGSDGSNTINIKQEARTQFQNFIGVNTINVEEETSEFTVYRSGATVFLSSTAGTFIELAATLTPQTLRFADGSSELVISDGDVMLGSQIINVFSSDVESPSDSNDSSLDVF